MNAKRLFVLDTNVLMHDPTALYRFQEHDVYLPMVVLEELDAGKKGTSEVARNVRQVTRFLDDLIKTSNDDIATGIPITGYGSNQTNGRLFFQTRELANSLPATLPGSKADNSILSIAQSLQKESPELNVTLVSKDINLRVKARVLGIHTEDYQNDKVLDDVNLLYGGFLPLSKDFWDKHSNGLESWQEKGRIYYRLRGEDVNDWYPNQGLFLNEEGGFEALVKEVKPNEAVIQIVHNYRAPHHGIWGINARNREQNYALNLLMDDQIDFVTLLGVAGSGKTLMALAAGLTQILEKQLYREIIVTRVTVPVGEDIGFLPGTEEEKMTPWMGALMDNLEVLNPSAHGHNNEGDWGRAATNDILSNKIKIRSLNFMRGRTFLNRYIILDEAQNLTPKQMKTLITRAGPGTKIVCLGNIGQIDTPYLSETTSGLTYVVDRFKNCAFSGHITLQRGERSRLADYATEIL